MKEKQRSIWSLELVVAVGIPLSTIVAGLFTLYIASHGTFTPMEDGADRFGKTTTHQHYKEADKDDR